MTTNKLPTKLKKCTGLFKDYSPLPNVFDEYFNSKGMTRAECRALIGYIDQLPKDKFLDMHLRAQDILRELGVTFNVYANHAGVEKIFPFDLLPRIISQKEWNLLERGLEQRVLALNSFLSDVYGEQKILKDKYIPEEAVLSSNGFLPQLMGIKPPGGVYIHIAGIDLIRISENRFVILEDNLKVPSGVSYVLENRMAMKRLMPDIFNQVPISSVENYPSRLREALFSLAFSDVETPLLVLLTPGPYNSAYFEHAFLARRMGCPLVENSDLLVEEDMVYLKTDEGLKRVHMIYRRVDEEYIDPTVFNPISVLGIPGLVKAYSRGNVLIANALGNGVADDKAIYPFVPKLIRYYLGEEPLFNQVPTYSCLDPEDCRYVLEHLPELVTKVVNQSGGYGMLIGPQASKKELKEFSKKILANPRDYIAQPVQEFSTCPTFINGSLCPRRLDFRPYIVTGKTSWVLPGGLSRVALVENSYVVNSSQGGGSKDTWVLQ